MAERWRDIAGPVGQIETGARNAITDVPGVRVGHSQALSGEATGVTVIEPPTLPAVAGAAVVNGLGELTGRFEIDARGSIETPSTFAARTRWGWFITARCSPPVAISTISPFPVVGECDDSWRADSRTVVAADVDRALAALGDEVPEGTVGAGSGMMCFEFPGGIGTASRRVAGFHVGVLLLCNFGDRERLDLLGTTLAPVDESLAPAGSCIAVCATDAPLSAVQLKRLALRPLLGLARAGSYAAEGSGEIGLAFSTGRGEVENSDLSWFFAGAYEAAHEAVYNCLVAAKPGPLRSGGEQEPFPVELVRRLAGERASRPPPRRLKTAWTSPYATR